VLQEKLTDDFQEQFNSEWFDLKVVPDLIVPLTIRGVEVVKTLWNNLGEFVSMDCYVHLQPSTPIEIATSLAEAAQRESDRLDPSDRLGSEPR
jgi:hypothetical protein